MDGSPFLKHFPLFFWCLTGLDSQSRRFKLAWISWTVASCSVTLFTSVYRLMEKGYQNEVVHGKIYDIPIVSLILANTAILIVKKEKISELIESLLLPFATFDSCFLHSKTLRKLKKWVNVVGAIMEIYVYLIVCCIIIGLGPLLWAVLMSEAAAIQDLPLPFGWIPYPTDSYLVYAVAYVISTSSIVLGGGAITACCMLMIYSALGAKTMLKLLADEWEDLDQRVDGWFASLFPKKPPGNRRRQIIDAQELIKMYYIRCFVKRSVKKHVNIIGYVKLIDSCFYSYIMVYCQLAAVITAFAIPKILTPDVADIQFWFAVTIVNSAMFCGAVTCFCGQIIIDESENLHRALYKCRWTDMHQNVKSSLLIITTVAHRPLHLTAGGTIPLNFTTFSKALHAVYSYVNLLLTLKN